MVIHVRNEYGSTCCSSDVSCGRRIRWYSHAACLGTLQGPPPPRKWGTRLSGVILDGEDSSPLVWPLTTATAAASSAATKLSIKKAIAKNCDALVVTFAIIRQTWTNVWRGLKSFTLVLSTQCRRRFGMFDTYFSHRKGGLLSGLFRNNVLIPYTGL